MSIAIGWLFQSPKSFGQQTESPLLKKLREKPDPIAEYNSSEPTDPRERVLRQRKNAKFGSKRLRPNQAGQFALNENSSVFLYSSSFQRPRPAFPISPNMLIVVGKIIDAKAFLNDDKSGVYSEFALNIEDVLKQVPSLTFERNNVVILTRPGGKVRLPSGKILYRGNYGIEMPEVGKRYLMFLADDRETGSFDLHTAYELQGGRIIPLDGMLNNEIMGGYSEQYKYLGMDENSFINMVRAKISEMRGI